MTDEELIAALLGLREDSIIAGRINSESAIHELMKKYDMLFLGGKFNTIYSVELCHMLNTKMHYNVSQDDLLKMIPRICSALGMHTEAMVRLADMREENPPIAQYSIELF